MNNKCWTCKYKKEVPGNCHIGCGHMLASVDSMARLAKIMGVKETDELSCTRIILMLAFLMGFTLNEHGVKKGWCMWPILFDPVWLDGDCRGYEKEVVNEQTKS